MRARTAGATASANVSIRRGARNAAIALLDGITMERQAAKVSLCKNMGKELHSNLVLVLILLVHTRLQCQMWTSARRTTVVVTRNANARTRRVAEHVPIAQLDGPMMARRAAKVGVDLWIDQSV